MDRDIEVLRRAGVDVTELLKQQHRANPSNHFIASRLGARFLEQGMIKLAAPLFQRRLLLEDPSGSNYEQYRALIHRIKQGKCDGSDSICLTIDCRSNGLGDIIFFSRVIPMLGDITRYLQVIVPPTLHRLFCFVGLNRYCDLCVSAQSFSKGPGNLTHLKVDIISAALAIWSHSGTISVDCSLAPSQSLITSAQSHACLLPFAAEKLRHLLDIDSSLDLSRRSMSKQEINMTINFLSSRNYKKIAVLGHESDFSQWWDDLDSPQIIRFPNDFLEFAQLLAGFKHIYAVDSAAFHLSGLLGMNTTLILPTVHDWRYGSPYIAGDSKVSWYKNSQIFSMRLPLQANSLDTLLW